MDYFKKSLYNTNPTMEELLMQENEEADLTVSESESGMQNDNEFSDIALDNAMANYMSEIAKTPLLSVEEEQKLGKIIKERKEGWLEARNQLVQANLRLVIFCAGKFLGRGIELEDLNSMGIEGLIHAAEKYDYSMGFRFSTYASWWINNAISRGIANEFSNIKVPTHVNEDINKVRRARLTFEKEYGYEPSIDELASFTKLSQDRVINILQIMYKVVSLDASVKESEKTTSRIEDLICDQNANYPCENALNSDLKSSVREILGKLPYKEALVLSLRFGIGISEPMSLDEIGRLPQFNVTRERIRQIQLKAIRTIKNSPKMMSLISDYAA